MHRNILIGIIIAIVLGVGAWWYLNQSNTPALQTAAHQDVPSPMPSNTSESKFSFALNIKDSGVYENKTPWKEYEIILQTNDKSYQVNTFKGSTCTTNNSATSASIEASVWCSDGSSPYLTEWVVSQENGAFVLKTGKNYNIDASSPDRPVEYTTLFEVK